MTPETESETDYHNTPGIRVVTVRNLSLQFDTIELVNDASVKAFIDKLNTEELWRIVGTPQIAYSEDMEIEVEVEQL